MVSAQDSSRQNSEGMRDCTRFAAERRQADYGEEIRRGFPREVDQREIQA